MLTEEEVRTAAHEMAKETLRELADKADEMEDLIFLEKVERAYAKFMEPIHKSMVRCS